MVRFAETVISGLSIGCMFALLGIAMNLIMMTADVLNIAITQFAALGVLVVIYLNKAGWPLPVSIVVVVAAAGIFGGFQYDASLRGSPKGRTGLRAPFVITLAVALIMEGIAQWRWGNNVFGLRSFTGDHPIRLGGVAVPTQSVWVVGSAIAISIALWFVFTHTLWGKMMRAVSQDKEAARIVGINVERVTRMSFAVAAALAAYAGAVIVPITFVSYDSGVGWLIFTFIALGVAGFAKTSAALLGGLAVGLLDSFIASYVSALYVNAIVFMALLTVLAFFPAGLLGRAEDVVTRA